ncbi:ATP-binding protein [Verrucomicrobium sp. BvORR106]|uniref:sensor histidine kinase n=1 Tax=Verrucomicrobium sp. BvORR106 TaxID=1403819 RepID=UPI000571D8A2|nr:ATP-binding protein [Verrucomicrobium sp. BvORR106]
MIRSWHRWLFTIAAFLLLVALAANIRSARLTEQNITSVLHTDEVMARFLRLRALLSETESTARGYALAGDTVSLALMGQSRADALLELRRIEEMTHDNPVQQELLVRVRELAESRFAAFDLMVTQRGNAVDPRTMIPLVDEGRGLSRALQARMDEGLAREQLLFDRRNARTWWHLHMLHLTSIGSGVMAIITAAAGLFLMKRAQKSALKAAVLELDKARVEHIAQKKSRFLANVSHEIRNPLTSIIGHAELLARSPDSRAGQESLAAIQASGRSLLRLVNDLLDLSRMEVGRLKLDPTPINVRDVLHEVAVVHEGAIRLKGLAFICRTSPEVPPLLELDVERLKQVLGNLVSNALKFTAEGSIALEAFGTRVAGTHPKFDLQFRVSDTGVGISETDQKRIFRDYEQVAENAAGRGTGLGLSISRQLVQLMGGTIALKSETGEGSFFTINLPGVPVVPGGTVSASADEDAKAETAAAR